MHRSLLPPSKSLHQHRSEHLQQAPSSVLVSLVEDINDYEMREIREKAIFAHAPVSAHSSAQDVWQNAKLPVLPKAVRKLHNELAALTSTLYCLAN